MRLRNPHDQEGISEEDLADMANVEVDLRGEVAIISARRELEQSNHSPLCIDCHDIISIERWSVRPGCLRCVPCQNQEDGVIRVKSLIFNNRSDGFETVEAVAAVEEIEA